MSRVSYIAGASGTEYPIDGDAAYIGYGGDLRSHEWEHELIAHNVTGAVLLSREIDVLITATHEMMDTLRNAFDTDVATEKPGRIIIDGKLSQRCYVVAADAAKALPQWVQQKYTFALLDGYWWHEVSKDFFASASSGDIDYPFDYPHDYGHSSGRGSIKVSGMAAALPRITFFGPCTNPYVVVGGNRYECDVSVVTGSKVVLDGTGDRPTATLYDSYGNATDVFRYAVRDGGSGGGSYAYEPIPKGTHVITWSSDFALQIAWRERETEPPWNL